MNEQIKELIKVMNDKEMFDLMADMMGTALDSFMKKGFTREEAFQLIESFGISNKNN